MLKYRYWCSVVDNGKEVPHRSFRTRRAAYNYMQRLMKPKQFYQLEEKIIKDNGHQREYVFRDGATEIRFIIRRVFFKGNGYFPLCIMRLLNKVINENGEVWDKRRELFVDVEISIKDLLAGRMTVTPKNNNEEPYHLYFHDFNRTWNLKGE